ncbi:acyl-CoA dehydrogenase family protein [Actinocorallia aurantiaca]|uniref:Acyl-CoA dehydrogenase family protein n=1 Tax=Actinocorallia aurantiaca TaxID=46204 RepID=A0ABN3UPU2_9ACTN
MKFDLVPPASRAAADLDGLRREVRALLAEQRSAGVFTPTVDSWGNGWNPEFSRALAERGWVGMTVPRQYGGGGRSFVERFAVTEELLAAGAPVSAHWVADRQVAPSLLRHGTDEQRARFLPPITRAEEFWAIGMSEPGSGSDLASVRTKAVPVEGGWIVSGTKLWTSGAHHAHFFIVLARTAPTDPERRHEGLSQFIVPLDAPHVRISPVLNLSGEHHFNEVVLDEVYVPDGMLLGEPGTGWRQVTAELGFERSGSERFLSTYALLAEALREAGSGGIPSDPRLGALVGRHFGLHHMSLAVSQALERGDAADIPAAVVKLLGTQMEGDVVDVVDELVGPSERDASPVLAEFLRAGVLSRPGFTIRGGTTQVLNGVVARGLGLR